MAACLVLRSELAHAQVVLEEMPVTVTLEGYVNANLGATTEAASNPGRVPDAVAFDVATRALARVHTLDGPDLGVRAQVEGTADYLRLSEASLLIFGRAGRLEIGKRRGLPDVLTGYAPNAFTFTMAEFGPPTGRTLDPGGGLATQFLPLAVRSRLEPLTAHGVTASLFNDESVKILYVLPRTAGWLGGVSFSPDAEDPRFDRLLQLGLVHESYWQQNVWRWGGTYADARAAVRDTGDLHSFSLGASVVVDDDLEIGVSGSHDAASRTSPASLNSTAWGAVASVNYNSGPWIVGSYYQYASAPAPGRGAGQDRLSALEAGASYRFTTRLRIYAAWLHYDLRNDHHDAAPIAGGGNTFTLGLRATL
jgi:hypothetical protein